MEFELEVFTVQGQRLIPELCCQFLCFCCVAFRTDISYSATVSTGSAQQEPEDTPKMGNI